MGRLYIGTSGWNYNHWADGVFYPEGLPQRRWLEFYSKEFNCVELNVTFYRMPKPIVFENWRKRTPEDFYFIVKGSRFITHIKKIKGVKLAVRRLIKISSGLRERQSCILWQFPPSLREDIDRLADFCDILKKEVGGVRQAFEFRNQSWFTDKVYRILKRNNFCLVCAHSGRRFPCVKEVTADFIYLRFHGGGSLYSSNYSEAELREWARYAKGFKKEDIFAFFNNDSCGYAVNNARRFRELLAGQ